jgi:hypothetical protein
MRINICIIKTKIILKYYLFTADYVNYSCY